MDTTNNDSKFSPPKAGEEVSVKPATAAQTPVQPVQKPVTTPNMPLPPLPADGNHKPKGKIAASKGLSIHMPKILIALLILACIAAPIVVIVQSNIATQNKEQSGKIIVDTKNDQLKNALTEQLVYSDSGAKDYYSPGIDVLFTYSADKFTVTDSAKSVLISPYNNYDIYGSLELQKVTDIKDPYDYYTKNYKALYTTSTASTKEENSGITTFTINYQVDSFTKPGQKTDNKATIMYRQVNDMFVILSVRQESGSSASQQMLDEYKNILQTVKISPQGINSNIVAKVTGAGAKVSFDRKKWTVTSQTNSVLSLSLITAPKQPTVTLRLYASPFKGFADPKTITDKATKDLDYDKEYYKDKNFQVLQNITKQTIAGVDFITYSSMYSSGGYSYLSNYYLGYVPSGTATLEMRVLKFNQSTQGQSMDVTFGQDEIQKVLDSLSFEQKQSQTPTKQGTQSSANTTTQTDVLGESTVTIEKAALLGKSSVVRIFSKLCSDVKINMADILPTASQKTYQICIAGIGSGFFVNDKGYIVTNAHVGAPNPFDSVMEAFRAGKDSGILNDIKKDVEKAYIKKYPTADLADPLVKKDIATVTSQVFAYGLVEGKISAKRSDMQSELYIETSTPFDIDAASLSLKQPQNYARAELVKARDLESQYQFLIEQEKAKEADPKAQIKQFTINVADVAILKLSAASGSYPALKLANPTTLSEGTPIYAIGFPALADSKELFSASAASIPTITKGTISAIKPNASNQFKLVQIDAAISPGNSGGPILNSDGEVIGVSTYGISGSTDKDYNAGVSVEEVQKLLGEASLTNETGSVSDKFISGLDNFSKEYYQWSIRDLKDVKGQYPLSSATVDPLIALAQEKIEKGLDNTPVYEIAGYFIHKNDLPIIYGASGIGVALVLIFIVMHFMGGRGKRTEPQAQQNYSFPNINPNFPASSAASVPQPTATVAQTQATAPVMPVTPAVPSSAPATNPTPVPEVTSQATVSAPPASSIDTAPPMAEPVVIPTPAPTEPVVAPAPVSEPVMPAEVSSVSVAEPSAPAVPATVETPVDSPVTPASVTSAPVATPDAVQTLPTPQPMPAEQIQPSSMPTPVVPVNSTDTTTY